MRLFVGNLSFDTTENELQDAFEKHGTVADVKVMTEHGTGRSRGFAFVSMGSQAEGEAAIAALNGTHLDGRALNVNEARAREERGNTGGNRGGGGGGRGNFGGGGGGRSDRSYSGNRRY